MKAFSWEAQATSLPPRRETTTLLVPTSMPTGCEPPFTRSSIFSGASSAGFHRWSLFSAMGYPPLAARRARAASARSAVTASFACSFSQRS